MFKSYLVINRDGGAISPIKFREIEVFIHSVVLQQNFLRQVSITTYSNVLMLSSPRRTPK